MSSYEEELATIFGNAEGIGYLDHKYAEVMFAQVSELLEGMQTQLTTAYEAAAMLNADLAVANVEISHLEQMRQATKIYLGLESAELPENNEHEAALTTIRRILNTIIAANPNQKIHQIKSIRGNEELRLAMREAQGTGGQPPISLVEAKDIADCANDGYVYIKGQKVSL